jgi:hypothetical protein
MPQPDACKLDSTVTTWDETDRTFDETTCADAVAITGSGVLASAAAAVSGSGEVAGHAQIGPPGDPARTNVIPLFARGAGKLVASEAKVAGVGVVSWDDDNARTFALLVAA